jgi:hypothetical protein
MLTGSRHVAKMRRLGVLSRRHLLIRAGPAARSELAVRLSGRFEGTAIIIFTDNRPYLVNTPWRHGVFIGRRSR